MKHFDSFEIENETNIAPNTLLPNELLRFISYFVAIYIKFFVFFQLFPFSTVVVVGGAVWGVYISLISPMAAGWNTIRIQSRTFTQATRGKCDMIR